jgi:beta-lactamase regulating signal transducer with metallopeptidase domain
MPKKKSQRNSRAVIIEPSKPVKPWVRWSAIIVIFALLVSIMLAAISSAPAKAASPSPSPTPTVCKPIDTDHDGIPNNLDPDIDGDGLVNGRDSDIDGDGITNAKDNDPAATNCEQSTTPPILNNNLTVDGKPVAGDYAWVWAGGVLVLGFGYLALRRARRRR